jgi:hypothetical protein
MLAKFKDHPLVGEVRSIGLLGAIELVADKRTRRRFADPGRVGLICRDHFFREGFIMRAVYDTMVMAPPLIWTQAQFDEAEAVIAGLTRRTTLPEARRMSRPIVVIPSCTKLIEGNVFDSVGRQYSTAIAEVAECQPLLIPLGASMTDIGAVLEVADAILLSGSRSNVAPEYYGTEETLRPEAADPARDALTLPLIRAAVERKTPLARSAGLSGIECRSRR